MEKDHYGHSEFVTVIASKKLGLAVIEALHEELGLKLEVVTFDDKHDGKRSAYNSICRFCNDRGIRWHELDAEGLEVYLKKKRPLIGIVCGWYWLISSEALASCKLGCLGIHNSILPAHRGCAPLIWSIIGGDRYAGATLFQITDGMDDGGIVKTWKTEIRSQYTVTDILRVLEEKIADEIGGIVKRYLEGTISLTAQEREGISYGGTRNGKDSEIDWSMSPEMLERHCRALQEPYPVLYFQRRRTTYLVKRLQRSEYPCFGKVGQVIANLKEGILVKCGRDTEGVVLVEVTTQTEAQKLEERIEKLPVGVVLKRQHE